MPKNKKGGKGHKKGKNSSEPSTRPLLYRESDQAYAMVIKALGDRRFQVQCYQVPEYHHNPEITPIPKGPCVAKARGALRKRTWIKAGQLVLVAMRDFQSSQNTVDILHRYDPSEARRLVKQGELTMAAEDQMEQGGFVFEDVVEEAKEIDFDAEMVDADGNPIEIDLADL